MLLLAYRRKSSVRDNTDLVSPAQQTAAVIAFLQAHHPLGLLEWYEDLDRSARQEAGRPGWQALMSQLDRPDVDGVIAWSFDRLYRNVHQFLLFLNRLEALNKRLIVVRESLDTSTPIGRAIVTILMVIAQLESDQTSERMKTGIAYRRETQGRHWGPTPYGCDRDEAGHLIPSERVYYYHPATAQAQAAADTDPPPGWEARRPFDALALIYEQYATGAHSYDTLTAALNAAGWRFLDRHGQTRDFDRDDVRRALNYWQLFRGDLPTGKIQRHTGPILPGGHQPVLPVDLCNRVGAMLAQRGRQHPITRKGANQRLYILSGVLVCGGCGKKLRGSLDHNLEIYRHVQAKGDCAERWVGAEAIEAEAVADLIKFIQGDFIIGVRAKADKLLRLALAANSTAADTLTELDRQQARLKKLEDLYLDDDIDRASYSQHRTQIIAAITKLQTTFEATPRAENITVIIDRMIDSIGQLQTAPPELQKTIITSIYTRLEVTGGRITRRVSRPWAAPFFELIK